MSYYSSGLITQDGELLNGPASLANGVLVCNADGSSVISSIDSILGFTPANDAQVVHLAGTETITGAKTFTEYVNADDFNASGTLALRRNGAAVFTADATRNILYRETRPSVDNNYDFGNSSYGWRSGYFGTSVVTPAVASDATLSMNGDTGVLLKYADATKFAIYGSRIDVNQDMRPGGTSGTKNLGQELYQWGEVATESVKNYDGALALVSDGSGGVTFDSRLKIRPSSTNLAVIENSASGAVYLRSAATATLFVGDSSTAAVSLGSTTVPTTIKGNTTIGGSTPGEQKTLQLYGNLNIQQNAGQGGNLIHVVDALSTDLFALTTSGTLYGSHIQNLGTSDSPTFAGLSVNSVVITDSSGFTSLGYASGNESTNQSAFGTYAGYLNTGANQSALGTYAGRENTGDQQTAVGVYAGWSNAGERQTVAGVHAGRGNTGTNQTSIGYYAGRENTGTYQSAFGSQAGYLNTGNNCVFIGYQAGYQNSTHNRFELKQNNVNNTPLISGDFSTGALTVTGTLTTSNDKPIKWGTGVSIYGNDTSNKLVFLVGSAERAILTSSVLSLGALTDTSQFSIRGARADAANNNALGFQTLNSTNSAYVTRLVIAGQIDTGRVSVYGNLDLASAGTTITTPSVTITDSTSGHTIYGYNAGVSNTGARIVAFGQQALQNNSVDYCTAVGYVAGYSNSGASLAALGYGSGQYNQGPGLSVVGHQAGLSNTGSYGTGVGYRAIQNNTGDYVSAIGSNAGDGNTGDNCVFIGRQAGLNNTASNRFELKQASVNATPLIAGDFSTGALTIAGTTSAPSFSINTQDANNRTILGYNAGSVVSRQTTFGESSGQDTTGADQTSIGYAAGRFNTKGFQTAVGSFAGYLNTGANPTSVGYFAGRENSGNHQAVVGQTAGYQNGGHNQSALGSFAGRLNTGSNQTAVGFYAGRENTGAQQIAVGVYAGYLNTGDNCVFIGYQAGQNNTTANRFELKQNNVNPTPLLAGNFLTGAVVVPSSMTIGTATAGSTQLYVEKDGGASPVTVAQFANSNATYNQSLSVIFETSPSKQITLHGGSATGGLRYVMGASGTMFEIENATGNVVISNAIQVGIGGPKIKNSGTNLQVRNAADNNYGPLICSLLVANTGIAIRSGSADPTTTDLTSGYRTTWKNTTSGEIRDWVNDGGVMYKSAAYVAA